MDDESALVTEVALSTLVQKLLLNWSACTQSRQNRDFLLPVFDFIWSIRSLVSADQRQVYPKDEIDKKKLQSLQ